MTDGPAAIIHPSAAVHPGAKLGPGVRVGPFCVVGEHVEVGEGTAIGPHAVLDGWTRIGRHCEIGVGALIGAPPQDKKYGGGRSFVVVGDRNVIREYATIHRATDADGSTVVGDDNYIMTQAHVAHNCTVGSHVVIANAVALSGHVVIEDYANVGGGVLLHQFTRVGAYAFVGGGCRVRLDVVPFAMATGDPLRVYGLNREGLKRNGFAADQQRLLKAGYRVLFWSGLNVADALARLKADGAARDEIGRLIRFVESSRRGLTPGVRVETGEGAEAEEA